MNSIKTSKFMRNLEGNSLMKLVSVTVKFQLINLLSRDIWKTINRLSQTISFLWIKAVNS